MSAMERIYRIDLLLAGRKAVPRAELQEKLGVSWATLKRDLAYMKDRLHAPIVFNRDLGGYRFEREGQRIGPQYELPGLWFSAEEIHALLTMQHLLANLYTGGLLGPHIQPLLARLSGLLGSADNPAEEVKKRIRVETVGARRFHLSHFQVVGASQPHNWGPLLSSRFSCGTRGLRNLCCSERRVQRMNSGLLQNEFAGGPQHPMTIRRTHLGKCNGQSVF